MVNESLRLLFLSLYILFEKMISSLGTSQSNLLLRAQFSSDKKLAKHRELVESQLTKNDDIEAKPIVLYRPK